MTPSDMETLLFSPSVGVPIIPSSKRDRISSVRRRRRPHALAHSSTPVPPKSNHAPRTYSRRTLLQTVVHLPIVAMLSPLPAHSAPSKTNTSTSIAYPELHGLDEEPDTLPPFRTISGIRQQEIIVGNGAAISSGSQVSVKYVLRRSNGYFIDASYGFDRFDNYVFRFDSPSVIRGFNIGVEGMREGGRRRFIVPPNLGYINGTRKQDPGPIPPEFGPRRALASHAREPLIFEVLVVRVRPPAPS